MKSNFIYDLIIIGGGISACVFASKYFQNNITKKVALIEVGRGLGGRSSSRKSKKFKGWELNHGAPNFNICNSKNNVVLNNYIDDLLANKFIKIDDSEFIQLCTESNLDSYKIKRFFQGKNYISTSSMGELSKKIISLNDSRGLIDFYFEHLIVELEFNQNQWTLISKNGIIFKCKYLVCSGNLILHKRSKEILSQNEIPFRKAIPKNKNKNIDTLLNNLANQTYIPRLTFLIYTKDNYGYKDEYNKKYRYYCLKSDLEKKYKFERIIFQLQKNKKLGIVIHSKSLDLIKDYLNHDNENEFKQNIVNSFNKLFKSNFYINQLTDIEGFSIMHWQASQPSGVGVPKSLQYTSEYQVGFCGDWFNEEGFGRLEGAILSGLNLANEFKSLNF